MTTDTYVISDSGKATINKDPNAVLDYTFDWQPWLDDVSDTLLTKTVTGDAGINVDSSAIVGKTVLAWLSGGTVNVTYKVVCHITTVGGRQDDKTIYVKIKEK